MLLIEARKLGHMVDRTRRVFSGEYIAKIAGTYHAWRGEADAGDYRNVLGFCRSRRSFACPVPSSRSRALPKTTSSARVYPRWLPELEPLQRAAPAELAAIGRHGTERYLAVLDARLAAHPFVCGDSVTLADYCGTAYVGLGDSIGFDLSPWPNVAAWIARMEARPGYGRSYAGFEGFVQAMTRAA